MATMSACSAVRSIVPLILLLWCITCSAASGSSDNAEKDATVAAGEDVPAADSGTAVTTSSAGDWPQYGKTESNLFSTELDLSGTPFLRWQTDLPGGVAISFPVASAGRAFVRMYGSGAAAIGLADGVIAWSDSTVGDGKYVTYAVDGPRMYTTDEMSGLLYALAVDTGEILWTLDLAGTTGFSSPKVRDHVLYLGGKTLRAVDPFTRKILWSSEGVGFASTPAVSEDRVYATACRLALDPGPYDSQCSDPVRLYAFDRATGAVVWRSAETLEGARSAPALRSPRVVVGGENTWSFDAATGELAWKADTGAGMKGTDFDSAPAVRGDRVFVVGGKIFSLDFLTGAVAWSHDGGNMRSTPVIAGNVLIVNDSDSYSGEEGRPSRLVALDAVGNGDGTTTERWSWPVERGDSSPIVVAGNVLFAAGSRLMLLGFPAQE